MEYQDKTEVVTIVDFNNYEHIPELALCLMNLKKTGIDYPSSVEVDNSASSLTSWLMSEDQMHRYVALVDGSVAGHISLVQPHPYLTGALDGFGIETKAPNGFLEISKFFVSPAYQRHGIGNSLFEKVISVTKEKGYEPALAVVDTSVQAISFYKHHGMTGVGEFDGIHGKNFIFV